MIAPWLRRHLEAKGLWNADGVTRHARVVRCPDCPTWTVVGLDDDRAAGAARCDADALTPLGETVALLGGRSTYSLALVGGRLQLDRRDQWVLAARPAASGDFDVVADHIHHTPMAPALVTTSHIRQRQTEEVSDVCPF